MGAMTEWTDIVQLVVSQHSLSPKSTNPAPTVEPPVIVAESATIDTMPDLEAGIPTLEDLAQNYPAMFTWDQVKDQVDSG